MRNIKLSLALGPLQYQSRPGRDSVCQGKGKFGRGGDRAVLFMVPLGLPVERSMVQGLWLPFEYYYYLSLNSELSHKNLSSLLRVHINQ